MNNFDERQLWIRGNIFRNMFWILAALIMVNACLARLDIVWADAFYSNTIIFFTAIAAGSIEMIFREVYFKNPKQQWFFVLFGIGGLFLFVMNIIHLAKGDEFISNGALTDTGGSFIYGMLIFSIGIGGAIKIFMNKIRKNEE